MVGIVAKERRKTLSFPASLSKCVPIRITLMILNPNSGDKSATGSLYADLRMILDNFLNGGMTTMFGTVMAA